MARMTRAAMYHNGAAAIQAKIPDIRSRSADGGTGGVAVRSAVSEHRVDRGY
jgi:hypothetical protein